MAEKPALITEKRSVGYRGKALIENIGISLEKGQILAFIGPNGAGKSTMRSRKSARRDGACH